MKPIQNHYLERGLNINVYSAPCLLYSYLLCFAYNRVHNLIRFMQSVAGFQWILCSLWSQARVIMAFYRFLPPGKCLMAATPH